MAERHPVRPGRTDMTLEERVLFLESHLAALHDQLWWLSLTPARREAYRSEGFRAPVMTEDEYNDARAAGVEGAITRFYEDV